MTQSPCQHHQGLAVSTFSRTLVACLSCDRQGRAVRNGQGDIELIDWDAMRVAS